MRRVFAPPHHYVVPSPYKQGESASGVKSHTLINITYIFIDNSKQRLDSKDVLRTEIYM